MKGELFEPLRRSVVFCGRFLPAFLGFGGLSAVGRALQLGAAGDLGAPARVALEIPVEGARCALVLCVLGDGGVRRGARFVQRLFATRGAEWSRPEERMRARWPALAASLVAFALIAGVLNGIIHAVAHHTSLVGALQQRGWLAAEAGPAVVVFFLKNVSVIPWAIVFMVVFTQWVLSPPVTEPGGAGHEKGRRKTGGR